MKIWTFQIFQFHFIALIDNRLLLDDLLFLSGILIIVTKCKSSSGIVSRKVQFRDARFIMLYISVTTYVVIAIYRYIQYGNIASYI